MSITPNKNRAANALTAYRQRERKRLHYFFAVLGNNAGTVETADDGIIWIQLHGDPNQVCRALTSSSIPCEDGDAGTTVKIEKLKRYAGGVRYRVLGLASEIQPGDPRNTLVARHAAQHEYADFNTGGADVVNIHADAVIALRAQPQAVPNMTLYVSPGVYQKPDGTAGKYNGGNSGAFSACALLERRCDLLYLASDGTTLTILEGTPTVDGSEPTRPTTPGNCTPIVWVWLDSSVTALDSFAYLESCRFMIGSSLSGVAAAAHNILSATHSDSLAAAVVAGDLMIGNATPKWSRLAAGAQYKILTMGAALPEWSAYLLQGTAGQTYTLSVTGGTVPTGSGTQNYVARWATASTLANSTIQDNATTASIGVAPVANQLLTIQAATATNTGLTLKTSDDSVTKNIFEIQNSTGTVLSRFTSAGDLYIGRATAYLGPPGLYVGKTLGAASAGIQNSTVVVSGTLNSGATAITANQVSLDFSYIVTGSAGGAIAIVGINGNVYNDQSAGTIATLSGNQVGANLRGAGTTTNHYGYSSYIALTSSGNVGTSSHFWARAPGFTSTGAITNMRGFYASNLGNAKVTNSYVLYCDNQSGCATATYGLYLGTATNGSYLNHHISIAGFSDVQQFIVTGYTTQAQATALGAFVRNDAAAGISDILALTGLGSGANGDGIAMDWFQKTSTTAAQQMARIRAYWVDATHASRTAALILSAWYTASERDALTIAADSVASVTTIAYAQAGTYTTTAVNLTLTTAHHWVKVTAACTITLPTAVGCAGRWYIITATADNVIVDGNGTETISGSTTQTLLANDTIQIKSDGANWWII